MTTIAMKLCSLILQEHFGETVRIVGQDLFAAVSKTVTGVCATTKLSRKQVKFLFETINNSFNKILMIISRSLLASLSSFNIDW